MLWHNLSVPGPFLTSTLKRNFQLQCAVVPRDLLVLHHQRAVWLNHGTTYEKKLTKQEEAATKKIAAAAKKTAAAENKRKRAEDIAAGVAQPARKRVRKSAVSEVLAP